MPSVTPIPVLGTQGFATDPVTKFSTAMAHFWVSDYNQTYLYPGQVASLPRIAQLSQNDIGEMQRLLKSQLEAYLGAYYTRAAVTVSAVDIDGTQTKYTVQLDIRVYDANEELTGAWRFDSTNNVIGNIIKLSNYGG